MNVWWFIPHLYRVCALGEVTKDGFKPNIYEQIGCINILPLTYRLTVLTPLRAVEFAYSHIYVSWPDISSVGAMKR